MESKDHKIVQQSLNLLRYIVNSPFRQVYVDDFRSLPHPPISTGVSLLADDKESVMNVSKTASRIEALEI